MSTGHGLEPDLAPADLDAAVEHDPPDRRRDGAVRGHRHARGVVRRVHRPAVPPRLGRARRDPVRDPRLRRRASAGRRLSPWVQGFRGAVLVMTLAVYPLVYPARSPPASAAPIPARRRRRAASGSVGCRRSVRVTLRQARGAIFGGALLVTLVILAEYGAFEILGYQTFTTEIFTELQSASTHPTACALSLVLVLLGIVVARRRRRRPGARSGRAHRAPCAQRAIRRHALGPWPRPGAGRVRRAGRRSRSASRSARASTGCSRGRSAPHRRRPRCCAPRRNTAGYSASAASLATAMAAPVALFAVRYGSRAARAAGAQHLSGAGDARAWSSPWR